MKSWGGYYEPYYLPETEGNKKTPVETGVSSKRIYIIQDEFSLSNTF